MSIQAVDRNFIKVLNNDVKVELVADKPNFDLYNFKNA